MTEGRQLFTAEVKTLAKGPSTYDALENKIRRFATVDCLRLMLHAGVFEAYFRNGRSQRTPTAAVSSAF
jgi:hypothetical protein